ncbi:MAG: hypothetical protein ACXVLT_04875 [Flavisolibacter sp.]
MKKILVLCLCFFAYSAVKAQETTTTTTTTTQHQAKQMQFYYYPSSNVYYDPTSKNYWYWDDASSQWTSVAELPTTVHLVKTDKVTVYHSDPDVWKDNAAHLKKYKTKKNGTTKAKGNG